jgi:hypothetical protein
MIAGIPGIRGAAGSSQKGEKGEIGPKGEKYINNSLVDFLLILTVFRRTRNSRLERRAR